MIMLGSIPKGLCPVNGAVSFVFLSELWILSVISRAIKFRIMRKASKRHFFFVAAFVLLGFHV
jgi:hypothetical protein